MASSGDYTRAMPQPTIRKLAAIVSTDVVSYSRLIGQDEAGTLARMKAHRAELWDPEIRRHGGRLVGTAGDSLLIEFASAVSAVECSLAVQHGMVEREAGQPDDTRLLLRIGVNIGEVVVDGEDIHGDGVNVAARLQAIAPAGGICLSGKVHDEIVGKIAATFDDAGAQAVKNIARPVQVWRWTAGQAAPGEDAAAPAPAARTEKPAIAVLPFDNMSGDAEQEYFVDGITEDIITELSKFRWLAVIARNSTFVYKNQAVDVPKVGRELGVGYVLEGSVRKAGERVRITAQLIEAATNEHIWAERYDRQLVDIFDLQDEMTQTLVGIIEPELANRERTRGRDKPTTDMSAWDLYQRALYHRWRFTSADTKIAHDYFDQAIAIDPGFAAAYAHRAWTSYVEILTNIAPDRAAAIAAGIADARRAIELDDRDALGYCAQGFILTISHDYARAAESYRRAIEFNPSFAAAHYGWALASAMSLGLNGPEACEPAVDMAVRLSPNDPLMWAFLNLKGLLRLASGDHEAALSAYRRANQLPNKMYWVTLGLAASTWHLGDEQGASAIVAAVRSEVPDISIARLVNFLGPGLQAFDACLLAPMRKAGLPEQ
ncbi:MAG: adenylate/guanylate cyclase domain-containing protein [Alphaproteobacteria bacterium]